MKQILLLGGFGFIATNLLKYIDNHASDKYEVIVFDRIDHHPHGVQFNCVSKVYAGDFSDDIYIRNIFRNHHINMVFHMLSTTVPSTSVNAVYDVETNLIATLKLMDIMREFNVSQILYLSSGGAIYGDYLQKVHNEEDAVYPKSSYGVVKLAIEKYLLSYAELFGFQPLILRVSNPYGSYHYNQRQGIINIAIRKALAGEELAVWGSGEGIKDYIYISDLCEIILRLIDNEFSTGVYNVASGTALSVNDITRAIKELIPGFKATHTDASMLDVENFELDITHLRNKLKGLVMTPFEIALRETIDWQRLADS